MTKLLTIPVVSRDCAIKLLCLRDFTDEEGEKRVAGDEWLEYGPKLYIPRIEVELIETINPITICSN